MVDAQCPGFTFPPAYAPDRPATFAPAPVVAEDDDAAAPAPGDDDDALVPAPGDGDDADGDDAYAYGPGGGDGPGDVPFDPTCPCGVVAGGRCRRRGREKGDGGCACFAGFSGPTCRDFVKPSLEHAIAALPGGISSPRLCWILRADGAA